MKYNVWVRYIVIKTMLLTFFTFQCMPKTKIILFWRDVTRKQCNSENMEDRGHNFDAIIIIFCRGVLLDRYRVLTFPIYFWRSRKFLPAKLHLRNHSRKFIPAKNFAYSVIPESLYAKYFPNKIIGKMSYPQNISYKSDVEQEGVASGCVRLWHVWTSRFCFYMR